MYLYFCKSNKRHTHLMETKRNKMLRNIETHWISMMSPTKRIVSEYMSLMVKMGLTWLVLLDRSQMLGLGTIVDLLVDMKVLLSLACFIPLLDVVYYLIKLFQACDIFICDFMQAIKVC